MSSGSHSTKSIKKKLPTVNKQQYLTAFAIYIRYLWLNMFCKIYFCYLHQFSISKGALTSVKPSYIFILVFSVGFYF